MAIRTSFWNRIALGSLIVLLLALPGTLLAQYSTVSDGSGGVIITAYSGTASSVSIPHAIGGKNVTSIGNVNGLGAFQNDTTLQSLTIPSTVTSIGEGAFENCSNLTSITFSSGLLRIGDFAFSSTGLTSLTLPGTLTTIGDGTFEYCSSLSSVAFPSKLTSIGVDAFYDCGNITSLTFPNSLTTIGEDAFQYCSNLPTVTIPNGVSSIGDGSFSNCSELTAINVATANPSFSSVNGVLYDKNKTKLIKLPELSFLSSFTIPNSVATLGSQAFLNSANLASLTIPGTISTLGDYEFNGCSSLTRLMIGAGVTSIGNGTFQFCRSLPTVTIPSSVTSIGSSAFAYCYALTTAKFLGDAPSTGSGIFASTAGTFTVCYSTTANGFTSPTWTDSSGDTYASVGGPFGQWSTVSDNNGGVIITGFTGPGAAIPVVLPQSINGMSVTGIGNGAFAGSSLTSVTIPYSVTSIGNYAFAFCSNLTNATYGGNAPTMGSSVFLGTDPNFFVTFYAQFSGFATPTWMDSSGDSYPATRVTITLTLVPPNGSLIFNGNSYAYTAVTNPAGYHVDISYEQTDGSDQGDEIPSDGPVNQGDYTVTATIDDPAYTGPTISQTATLTIAFATQEDYTPYLPSNLVVGATYRLGPDTFNEFGFDYSLSYSVTQGNATIVTDPNNSSYTAVTINGPGSVQISTFVGGGPNFNQSDTTKTTNATSFVVPITFNDPLFYPSGTSPTVTPITNPDTLEGSVMVTYTDSTNHTSSTIPTAVGSYTVNATLSTTQTAGTYTGNGTDTLIIYTPLTIAISPSNVSVPSGTTVTFFAATTGFPAPTVQWQVSTDGGNTYNAIDGATNPTYSFVATTGQSGSLYQAVFLNAVQSATSSAALLTVSATTLANTFLGVGEANTTLTGAANTGAGSQSFQLDTTGAQNTTLGYSALLMNTSGSFNTASGCAAMQYNATGSGNMADGYGALYNNTAGYSNTASGYYAMIFSKTGIFNTADGCAAMQANVTGSDNTASGYAVMFSNLGGSNNVASGFQAMLSGTAGANNTALGSNALSSMSAGSANTVAGNTAGQSISGGSNNIEIGDGVVGQTSDGTSADAGIIRLGTQGVQTTTFIAGVSGRTISGAGLSVNSNGQVGVLTSSARFKDHIHDMDSDELLSLQPVTYAYKPTIDPAGAPQFGLVAEEVAQVAPDLVIRDKDGAPYTVRYQAVNALLLDAFLKDQREVETQQAQLDAQQEKLVRIRAQFRALVLKAPRSAAD